MTAKDYRMVAETLRWSIVNLNTSPESSKLLDKVVHNFEVMCKADNPNFKPEKFRKAIYEV